MCYVVHNNVGAVEAAKTLRAIALQYRDQAGAWIEAGRVSWPEADQNKPHTLSLSESDAPAVSAEWRMVALEGGSGGELVMGWVGPVPALSTLRTLVNSLDLDLLICSFVQAAALKSRTASLACISAGSRCRNFTPRPQYRSDRGPGQDAVSDPSAHAAPWLRLCACQCRP
jgi:hypothetical protein